MFNLDGIVGGWYCSPVENWEKLLWIALNHRYSPTIFPLQTSTTVGVSKSLSLFFVLKTSANFSP